MAWIQDAGNILFFKRFLINIMTTSSSLSAAHPSGEPHVPPHSKGALWNWDLLTVENIWAQWTRCHVVWPLSSNLWHQQGIFPQRAIARWVVQWWYFGIIHSKPRLCWEIQVVASETLRSLSQPCHSKLLYSLFFIHVLCSVGTPSGFSSLYL